MDAAQHLSNDDELLGNQHSERNKIIIVVVVVSLVSFIAGNCSAYIILPFRRSDKHIHTRGSSGNVSTATSKTSNDASPSHNKLKKDPFPDSTMSPLLAPSKPQVAWLLSFPNSGTTYTLENIRRLTKRAIASNYAKEKGAGYLSVGSDGNGPFVSGDGKLHLPKHYILTKTHCGGYCTPCLPEEYILNTAEEFEKQCRQSLVPNGTKQDILFYPTGTAARGIHLFRHPFNNLVARMHLELKRSRVAPQMYPGFDAQVSQLITEQERVLAWCKYTDTLQASDVAATLLLSNSTKLTLQRQQPLCSLELFKYVQWHERAREMTTQLGLPVLYIYYEDYFTEQYNSTVSSILDFLDITRAAGTTRKPLVPHPPYKVFTKKQEDTMLKYIQQLSSKEGWKLLERYFR